MGAGGIIGEILKTTGAAAYKDIEGKQTASRALDLENEKQKAIDAREKSLEDTRQSNKMALESHQQTGRMELQAGKPVPKKAPIKATVDGQVKLFDQSGGEVANLGAAPSGAAKPASKSQIASARGKLSKIMTEYKNRGEGKLEQWELDEINSIKDILGEEAWTETVKTIPGSEGFLWGLGPDTPEGEEYEYGAPGGIINQAGRTAGRNQQAKTKTWRDYQ